MSVAAPRVCVIGAGAAGLVALRHLTHHPAGFEAISFERTKNVGGTWVYTPNTGVDEYQQPIHSSMYEHLKTNLPKEVMAFPDYPFPQQWNSFITHGQVLQYLEDYCTNFSLWEKIKFLTRVDNVEPISPDCSTTKWKVTVSCVDDPSNQQQHVYDAVMVCNGHYSKPLLPNLGGLSDYEGRWMHSHDYRTPKNFTGQTVLCLGAASSGIDITLELAPHAKQVFLSHRKALLQSVLPENVEQVPGIKKLAGNSIILEDDRVVIVDTLIFCTGYHYDFPFLSPSCGISVDKNEHVADLYKHCINIKHPSMIIIGIPKVIVPFPQFDLQVRYFIAVLSGKIQLPSEEKMVDDTRNDETVRVNKGMPARHLHHLGGLQWEYNNEVAQLGEEKALDKVIGKLYEYVHHTRAKDVMTYKRRNYQVIDSENFVEIKQDL